MKMTTENNEKLLISLVEKKEYLFNRYHPFYRNFLEKEKVWNEIAAKLNTPPKDCKAKWKALRDQYARELKRISRTGKDDGIRWKHFSDLDFLKKFITTRVELTPKKEPKIKTEIISNITIPNNQVSDQQQEIHEQQQQNPEDQEENWEFLHETADEFNEQAFETITVQQHSEPQLEQQSEHQQQQHHQINTTTMIATSSGNHIEIQQQEQNEEEEEISIHTFLKIEGYFEKELINLVKYEECLYNRTHPHYRNFEIKNETWEEIAKKLKVSVKQCRLKWKALRDQYTREYKRLKRKSLKQPIKIEETSRWRHYDALCYLEEFIRERKDKNVEQHQNNNFEEYKEYKEILLEKQDPHHEEQIIKGEHTDNQDSMDITWIEQEATGVTIVSEDNIVQSQSHQEHEPVIEHVDVNNLQLTTSSGNDITMSTASSRFCVEADEIEAFFKTITMKVRRFKLSPVAFTELQIEILRVINDKFRNYGNENQF